MIIIIDIDDYSPPVRPSSCPVCPLCHPTQNQFSRIACTTSARAHTQTNKNAKCGGGIWTLGHVYSVCVCVVLLNSKTKTKSACIVMEARLLGVGSVQRVIECTVHKAREQKNTWKEFKTYFLYVHCAWLHVDVFYMFVRARMMLSCSIQIYGIGDGEKTKETRYKQNNHRTHTHTHLTPNISKILTTK